MRHQQDAPFIKQVHGKGNDGERDSIRSGGDDGSNDQNGNDGVASVLLHLLTMKDAKTP